MRVFRRAAKVDRNQAAIVAVLRAIPGVTVAVGHDDILVGHQGRTYWYEVKVSEKASRRKSQIDLLRTWRGHYAIVSNVDEILEDAGITGGRK